MLHFRGSDLSCKSAKGETMRRRERESTPHSSCFGVWTGGGEEHHSPDLKDAEPRAGLRNPYPVGAGSWVEM